MNTSGTYKNTSFTNWIKYLVSIVFVCCFLNFCQAQSIILYTQGEVDSFSINYPGFEQISSLGINGTGITNLLGLSQLKKIEILLSIRNTSLRTLEGLENLESIDENGLLSSGIYIFENDSLVSLKGLDNVNFPSVNGNIEIIDNQNLSNCSQQFICDHILNHRKLVVYGNKDNCSNRPDLLTDCNIGFDISNKELLLFDGFETWNDSLPQNFDLLNIALDQDDPNIKKVTALTEGQSAVSIRNELGVLTSYTPMGLITTFQSVTTNINIELDCMCNGDGLCKLVTLEKRMVEGDTLIRTLWKMRSDDTSIYTLQFNNLIHSSQSDGIIGIGFLSSSIFPLIPGVAEFTIDNLKIYQEVSNATTNSNQKLTIYPNPTKDKINVHPQIEHSQYQVFNSYGELLIKTNSISNIDLEPFPSGIYFIVISDNLFSTNLKIIKN